MNDLQAIADRVEIEAQRSKVTDAVMMPGYHRAASLFICGASRMPRHDRRSEAEACGGGGRIGPVFSSTYLHQLPGTVSARPAPVTATGPAATPRATPGTADPAA
jgi:hypothetical protein